MSEADDTNDSHEDSHQERGGRRAFILAMLFLIVVGGGSYAIRHFYRGATLIVEADPPAAAVLGTNAVMLREVDGPLFYNLRPGEQKVRAGHYRIDVDWDETELTFSTGSEFTAERGERLVIQVTGKSVEP